MHECDESGIKEVRGNKRWPLTAKHKCNLNCVLTSCVCVCVCVCERESVCARACVRAHVSELNDHFGPFLTPPIFLFYCLCPCYLSSCSHNSVAEALEVEVRPGFVLEVKIYVQGLHAN